MLEADGLCVEVEDHDEDHSHEQQRQELAPRRDNRLNVKIRTMKYRSHNEEENSRWREDESRGN